jgi:hypothetical protein
MSVEVVFICEMCGQRQRAAWSSDQKVPLPEGWERGFATSPNWFDDDEETPPPIFVPRELGKRQERVYCSSEHRNTAERVAKETSEQAWQEGRALACKLYRERITVYLQEQCGAVTALGELGRE